MNNCIYCEDNKRQAIRVLDQMDRLEKRVEALEQERDEWKARYENKRETYTQLFRDYAMLAKKHEELKKDDT